MLNKSKVNQWSLLIYCEDVFDKLQDSYQRFRNLYKIDAIFMSSKSFAWLVDRIRSEGYGICPLYSIAPFTYDNLCYGVPLMIFQWYWREDDYIKVTLAIQRTPFYIYLCIRFADFVDCQWDNFLERWR